MHERTGQMNLNFTVFGIPQPQGSTRAFLTPAMRARGWTRPIITSDNAKLKPFRQELAQTALVAMREGGAEKAGHGVPVSIALAFYFPKPQSAKKSAIFKTTKPDVDKLLRAVLDALTGIAFEDDSQVCECRLVKSFGSPARVEVQVETIQGVPKPPSIRTPQLFETTRPSGDGTAVRETHDFEVTGTR
jgi:crossover junction endodeoxyribonuclease RusA